jgi:hypothetical protein
MPITQIAQAPTAVCTGLAPAGIAPPAVHVEASGLPTTAVAAAALSALHTGLCRFYAAAWQALQQYLAVRQLLHKQQRHRKGPLQHYTAAVECR